VNRSGTGKGTQTSVPERFTAHLPLTVPVSGGEALLFGARRLLQQLCGWLVGRGLGTTRWQLNLVHERLAATAVQIGCMPSRDPAHLLLLLREHLARRVLAAPVEALTLEVLETCPVEPRTRSLLEDEARGRASIGSLLDRLGARLGPEAATVLSLRDEHRPERAWGLGRRAASATASGHVAGPRPLWLLPEPQPIGLSTGHPVLEGPLDLLSGPERIESGWWDGADVARDYYVAVHGEGLRLWVFRDLRGAGWYLHGVFG
jgi:protein ImuB